MLYFESLRTSMAPEPTELGDKRANSKIAAKSSWLIFYSDRNNVWSSDFRIPEAFVRVI